MPYDQRLPAVAGDDGTWGNILNQFLEKEHYNTGTNNADNGGHKTITIRAGTATAGTAPLKFSSGTLLTAPEAGAMEFSGDNLYFTVTTGPVRNTISLYTQTSVSSGNSPAGDSRQNEYFVNSLSSGVTVANPSGSPVDGNFLLIRIKDNGVAQSLGWGAQYRAFVQNSLPSTTVAGKTMYLGFKYNSDSPGYWDWIAYATQP